MSDIFTICPTNNIFLSDKKTNNMQKIKVSVRIESNLSDKLNAISKTKQQTLSKTITEILQQHFLKQTPEQNTEVKKELPTKKPSLAEFLGRK